MAYITQEYEINGNTTLSTWEQLSDASISESLPDNESWVWEHRTLSCFVDENGNFIELNGTKVFDSPTARLSGVWMLNKSEWPVKIYAVGSNGRIQVTIKEINRQRPLGYSN